MTCRHGPNDPNCGSHPYNVAARESEYREEERQRKAKEKEEKEALARLKTMQAEQYAKTPDKERYEIVDFKRVGFHLVLKVLYPNCSKCSYEGNKVMVFLNVVEADVVKWRVIDPHFRERTPQQNAPREAPGPAARFPATTEGWNDAVNYAASKK